MYKRKKVKQEGREREKIRNSSPLKSVNRERRNQSEKKSPALKKSKEKNKNRKKITVAPM